MGEKRQKEGYIYVISNINFPNYYKIGVTEDIKSRLRTYQTSSPLRNYKKKNTYRRKITWAKGRRENSSNPRHTDTLGGRV